MCRSTKRWCGRRRFTRNTASRPCSGYARRESVRQRGSWSSRIIVAWPFDTLLIATGGRNRRLSIPGGDLEGIYSLRTVQDADRIRAAMIAGRRAVVVGMGFIGSEVAASPRQKGLDVVVVDPSKTRLFGVLGEAVGQTIAELHRANGVRTIFEDTVAAFEGTRRVGCVVEAGGSSATLPS